MHARRLDDRGVKVGVASILHHLSHTCKPDYPFRRPLLGPAFTHSRAVSVVSPRAQRLHPALAASFRWDLLSCFYSTLIGFFVDRIHTYRALIEIEFRKTGKMITQESGP